MQDHHPRRGDQVEAWIKQRRDDLRARTPLGAHMPGYIELNDLLDEYRLASDTGQSLENMVNGEPEDIPVGRPKKKKE